MTDTTAHDHRVALPAHVHNNTCGFCGSDVKTGFVTCTGCGATWSACGTTRGMLTLLAALPVGLVMGLLMAVITSGSFASSMIVMLGSMIGLGLWASSMREYAWARRQ